MGPLQVISGVIYNPFKWPYNWVTGVITLLIEVITPHITCRGPTLYEMGGFPNVHQLDPKGQMVGISYPVPGGGYFQSITRVIFHHWFWGFWVCSPPEIRA